MNVQATASRLRGRLATWRAEDTYGFSEAQVADVMARVYARGDRLMTYFLLAHFALALELAILCQTWPVTLPVGGAAVALFVVSARLMPRRFLTRCVAGIALQAFVALHIYQMAGLHEMHFVFFTAFTMMIVYQDHLCMWPGTFLIIIAQHILFAYLHNEGVAVSFWEHRIVTVTRLFFHFGIAIVQVGICSYWAYLLRHQTLREAAQVAELTRSRELIARQLERTRRSERELADQSALLARQTQDLARSNTELEQFAYVASHDLQEPLRMITSYLQLLERREGARLGGAAREFIGYAVDGALRMRSLIDGLLAFSRAGARGAPPRPVDAAACLREALANLEVALREAGAVVEAVGLPTLVADRSGLTTLFQNLLANAIKFRGPQAPRVTVSAEPFPGGWTLTVSDNGIGIAPEHAERISPGERGATAPP